MRIFGPSFAGFNLTSSKHYTIHFGPTCGEITTSMQALTRVSRCPAYTSSSITRTTAKAIVRPWIPLRFISRVTRRPPPSRMLLSDNVDQPARKDGPERRPSRYNGPFGGMNQTKAPRLPERRRPSNTTSSRSPRVTASKASKGDKGSSSPSGLERKALKMQRALATVSYGKRTYIKTRMQEFESFDQLNLLPSVKLAVQSDLLKGMVDIKPTPVQRLAIPALLGQENLFRSKSAARQDFLLAAETGSGKTLAYLLPAVNAMKIAEAEDPDIQQYRARMDQEKENQTKNKPRSADFDEPHPTMARPRIIVLVPTAELVDQVGHVAKILSHVIKFKSDGLSASLKPTTIHRNLYSSKGVDLIITTPHLLASIAESDPNVLSRVTHLIVDEADSLFDRSFLPVTTSIMDKTMPSLRQFVVCSATITKRLDAYLSNKFPDMVRITTPNLHAIPRRVQLGIIDVTKDPYRNNKNLACADAVYAICREAAQHESLAKGEIEVRRIMVFVNEREKTEEVANYLVSKGIDAVALNRDTADHRQSEMLASFTSSEPLRTPAKPAVPGGKRSLQNAKVVVATDLASRGIDTLAVRHVILYDVPHTTIDFIHRLGRAGRMGRRGRGIVLVDRNDRRDIVAEVKESMFMGQALI
jgi:ATP-dependent RNA helicase MRH4, mitochondrial